MGEARRRKLAGTDPDPTAGRATIAVEDYRAPPGSIAITFDVAGTAPMTAAFDASRIVDAMAEVERRAPPGVGYADTVRGVARRFVEMKQANRPEGEFVGVALLGLWTALNHPAGGAATRAKVSAALRDRGRAHITWQISENGFAVGVADRFMDLERFIAQMPRDRVAVFATDDEPVTQN